MPLRQEFASADGPGPVCLLVPEGLRVCPLPEVSVDFADRWAARPLAVLAAADWHVAVAWRPAYARGTPWEWFADLSDHFGIEVIGAVPAFVGAACHRHPGVLVEGRQARGGVVEAVRMAGIEDGGWFITAHARGPEGGGWEPLAESCLESLELVRPQGPTRACVPNGPLVVMDMPGVDAGGWPHGRGRLRAPKVDEGAWDQAVGQARVWIAAGRFDEADALLNRADPGMRAGGVASRLYAERLAEVAGRAGAEEVFRRAYLWACWGPDPHTEIEAEEAERAAAEARARLVRVLGYDPGRP
jgi:hypothetical protein